ncbi:MULTISPECIES: AAA family ATPase [unclassified Pseudomonas]|uniref:AAA family ATPase n=1 Tax=unclassified Pseudomonas TaxID=196821 RepID=UPI0004717D66|nr:MULTISPECIES: AAA family ATPase [unclassified Pseudomonas]
MQIKAFRLKNIGRFEVLDADFTKIDGSIAQVIVLIGNNGAGKTTILKSLSGSLELFIRRLRSEKSVASKIKDIEINNAAKIASIGIDVEDQSFPSNPSPTYSWTRAGARAGMLKSERPQNDQLNQLAHHYRDALTQQESFCLPLIAYYPVERSVTETPLKARNEPPFPQLQGYQGAADSSIDFTRFFQWFRDREDHENELKASSVLDRKKLLDILGNRQPLTLHPGADSEEFNAAVHEYNKQLEDFHAKLISMPLDTPLAGNPIKDVQLDAVRHAIESFIPEFKNLRIQRKPYLKMLVDKEGQTLDILQLSQGEKSLMALIGDIARRLAMLNPGLEQPLLGKGVVLIDEIDMHLHPKWQRGIAQQLTTVFPQCQFILTTHSPLVISDIKDSVIFSLDNGKLSKVASQFGQDANSVLLDVMDTAVRNIHVDAQLNDLYDAIHDRDLEKARHLLAGLENDLPSSNLELAKAKLMLRKQELRLEKN